MILRVVYPDINANTILSLCASITISKNESKSLTMSQGVVLFFHNACYLVTESLCLSPP